MQIILTVLLVLPAYGQNDSIDSPYAIADTLQKDFGLFTREDILELSLRFDLTQFTRKKLKDEYLNAILTYYISDKDSVNQEIRLKSRGEFRNEYCTFPPISLNFKEAELIRTDFDKIGKMKLVTHCKTGNEVYLFKEYLIYKLYNILTDNSFRVRLLKINYFNTFKKSKPIQSYGFFIEPLDLLAERINSVPVNSLYITQKIIQPEMMDRMAIFNYMIGNTDWSVGNQHNCKILTIPNSSLGMIVPEDFDYSGLVNADYAIPAEGLGIISVRDRLYFGICRSEEVFLNDLKEFSDKKEQFYRVINEFPLLSERQKKNMISYLDEFYSGFDKRNSIVYSLLLNCKDF
jgi:hypothetical protein